MSRLGYEFERSRRKCKPCRPFNQRSSSHVTSLAVTNSTYSWTCVFFEFQRNRFSFIRAEDYADTYYSIGQCPVIWSCGGPRSFAAFRSSGRCARVAEHSSCGRVAGLRIAGWSLNLSDSACYSCLAYREPSSLASCSLSSPHCSCVCLAAEDPELSVVSRKNPVDSIVLAWP